MNGRKMKAGPAFAILFGLLALVLTVATIWTSSGTLSDKLGGSALLFFIVAAVAMLAADDLGRLYRDDEDGDE